MHHYELGAFWQQLPATDAIALVDAGSNEIVSFRQLIARADGIAEALNSEKKSVVFLLAGNNVSSCACILGVLRSKHALFLVDQNLTSDALERMTLTFPPAFALHPQSNLFFGALDRREPVDNSYILRRFAEQPYSVHPELKLLLSTSGTLGTPRAVRLSARNLATSAFQVAQAIEISAADLALLALPISFVYGLSVFMSHMFVGASVALERRPLADRRLWRDYHEQPLTIIPGVGHTFETIKSSLELNSLTSLRALLHSGDAPSNSLLDWFLESTKQTHTSVYRMYGMTEACSRISVLPPNLFQTQSRSVGQAVKWSSLAIDDGEIIFRGPNVMMGYAKSVDDLSRGDDLGGVLRTGDLGRLRGTLLEIEGRRSRIAKVFGRRVNLDELQTSFSAPAAAVNDDNDILILFEESHWSEHLASEIAAAAKKLRIPPQTLRASVLTSLPRTHTGKIVAEQALALWRQRIF